MKPKKVVKDLEKALKGEPDNLVLRLKLAAALREVGRLDDAVSMYRSVAVAYHKQGRLGQAIAVCKSVLEIEPAQRETQALLAELDLARGPVPEPVADAPSAATPGRGGSGAVAAPPPPGQPPMARLQYRPVDAVPAAQPPPLAPPVAPPRRAPSPNLPEPDEPDPVELPAMVTRRPVGPQVPATLPPPEGDLRDPKNRFPLPAPTTDPGAVKGRPSPSPPPGRPPAAPPARPPAPEGARRSLPPPPPIGIARPKPPPPPPRPTNPNVTVPGKRGAGVDAPPRPSTPAPSAPPVLPVPQPGSPPAHHRDGLRTPARLPSLREEDDILGAPTNRRPAAAPNVRNEPEPSRRPASTSAATPLPEPHMLTDMATPVEDELPQGRVPYVPHAAGDDDGLTIPAFSPRWQDPPAEPVAQAPAPPAGKPGKPTARHASVFDESTRIADSLAEASHEAWDDVTGSGDSGEFTGEKTNPPEADPQEEIAERDKRDRTLPPDLEQFSRAPRLMDVGWPGATGQPDPAVDEEPRDRRDTVGTVAESGAGQGQRRTTLPRVQSLSSGNPTNPDAMPEADDPILIEDNLELARAFDRTFAADVEKLAPDGSTIEPLNFFHQLSREAHGELQRRMTFRRCAAGDLILREGDPGDACYIIQSGSVRILKRDPGGDPSDLIEIARLAAGSLFGEFALLADRRRHASVQAVEACELFEIPRRLLRELAANFPDVGPALERFFRERLVSTLLATAPFFQPLPEEQRGALMARFVARRVEAGGSIIREGEKGGGLYLIVLGNVDITKRIDARRQALLASLGEGCYFGEMSLLSGGLASATVSAVGPVELAQLSPKDFYDVVAAHPILWDELRREAYKRELANQNIMSGETSVV